MWDKIWKLIDYNRWLVAGLVLAAFVSLAGLYCVPVTPSPIEPTKMVDEKGLSLDFKTWQLQNQIVQDKFAQAVEDLKAQAERNGQIQQMIVELASGRVPDVPAVVQLLLGAGGLGAFYDNIRKRALISGLKIQVKNNAGSKTSSPA